MVYVVVIVVGVSSSLKGDHGKGYTYLLILPSIYTH